jgi:FkbM family methyltransferase
VTFDPAIDLDHGRRAGLSCRLVDNVSTFRVLERAAQPLRRAGLGALVDHVRPWFEGTLGNRTDVIDGLRITGRVALHSAYLDELGEASRESHTAKLFTAAVTPGSTAVDVGAHLGYFTLLAARAVGTSGRVLAIEPNPATLPLLRRNVTNNGFEDRVTIVDRALAAHTGRMTFYRSPAGDTSSLHQQDAGDQPVEVETVTLDELVAEPTRLSAIKIDVEGAEGEVLQGMQGVLEGAPAALRVFLECNPPALRRAGRTPTQLLAALRELQLEPQVIDDEAGTLLAADAVDSIGGYANLICAPAKR